MSWLLEYFEAWNRHDADGIVGYMCVDIEFRDMAMRHEVRGIENIPEFVRQSAAMSAVSRFDVGTHFVANDHFYAEWVWQPMNIPGVSVGQIRDGKIATQHDYWDKALFKKWLAAQSG